MAELGNKTKIVSLQVHVNLSQVIMDTDTSTCLKILTDIYSDTDKGLKTNPYTNINISISQIGNHSRLPGILGFD